jgi:hypothetical protein
MNNLGLHTLVTQTGIGSSTTGFCVGSLESIASKHGAIWSKVVRKVVFAI